MDIKEAIKYNKVEQVFVCGSFLCNALILPIMLLNWIYLRRLGGSPPQPSFYQMV